MRAMILAAGLGTRMRPLSDLRAKPALPVRGRPVISLLLEFLSKHGFDEVLINLHHLGDSIRSAVAADHPPDVEIHWSEEPAPLGTGGGIRRAADFLRGSDACAVLAGDMLLDVPLANLFERHRSSGRHATLLLREDERGSDFGTVGVDSEGRVIRVSETRLGTEPDHARGLFTGVRFFSREIFGDWPSTPDPKEVAHAFEDLRDWLIPGIQDRGDSVGAEIVDASSTVWEPVGTPAEYLRVNLSPPVLPTLGRTAESWQGEIDVVGRNEDVILSRKASVPADVELERAVVWDGERVPDGFRGRDGVYAGGAFRSCADDATGSIH